MEEQNKKEKLLNDFMQRSFVEMPFSDFEDKLMAKISEEKQLDKSVSKPLHVAWIFFSLGLFLGLLITNLMANLDYLIVGVSVKKITFFVQLAIAVILLLQFDKLLDFTIKKKN